MKYKTMTHWRKSTEETTENLGVFLLSLKLIHLLQDLPRTK